MTEKPIEGQTYAVTGAFSYTGKYITKRLLNAGGNVITLTGHPNESMFQQRVKAFPFNFDNPDKLIRTFEGIDTLINNYWVRFSHGNTTFDQAVENSSRLIEAAQSAGVRRIVHTSITNPDKESQLPYFSGKATLEDYVRDSGLSYAILRPTVIFGQEDILINNIAWYLRKFPVFGIPGDGSYKIQPIFVEDFAELVVEAAQQDGDSVVDAVGPDIFTFEEMVHLIAKKIESKAKIINIHPWLALKATELVGRFVHDVVLTKDEIKGLMDNLLYSEETPKGITKLSSWLEENKEKVGISYSSELERHF